MGRGNWAKLERENIRKEERGRSRHTDIQGNDGVKTKKTVIHITRNELNDTRPISNEIASRSLRLRACAHANHY